jgi:Rrf2 family cysteine metabolism transcriptional repressor
LSLSQKCQYAVRAMLELSMKYGQGAVPASEIAASQAIPQRFLEVIMNDLRPSGLVESRRGVQGGYYLGRPPREIAVGAVIRLVDGPLDPVRCTGDKDSTACPLKDRCSLIQLWDEAREAVEGVYDKTTFQDLADREKAMARRGVTDFTI